MKNVVLAAVAAGFVHAALSAAAPGQDAAEQRAKFEAMRAERIANAGGIVEKPDAARGKVVFFDVQGSLPREEIAKSLSHLDNSIVKYRIEVVKTAAADPLALMKSHGADVAVVICEKEGPTSLLSAPEEHWCEVNVRALGDGLATPEAKAKFWASRCRKEILRGFALACGALGSSFPGNIMGIAKTGDLDLCDEFMPVDTGDMIKKRLRAIGLAPRHSATYRAACKAGWAPPPTNDVQRAIWDKVHQLPTEPIKIKPETKKVSE